MPYCDDIRDQRAKLQDLDRALMPIQAGVQSEEASLLVGRARGMLRAADQVLASAMREEQPAATLAMAGGSVAR